MEIKECLGSACWGKLWRVDEENVSPFIIAKYLPFNIGIVDSF